MPGKPPAQAYADKRRKELWVMRHPEHDGPDMVGQVVPPKEPSPGKGNHLPKEKAFAADTAERTGQSKTATYPAPMPLSATMNWGSQSPC